MEQHCLEDLRKSMSCRAVEPVMFSSLDRNGVPPLRRQARPTPSRPPPALDTARAVAGSLSQGPEASSDADSVQSVPKLRSGSPLCHVGQEVYTAARGNRTSSTEVLADHGKRKSKRKLGFVWLLTALTRLVSRRRVNYCSASYHLCDIDSCSEEKRIRSRFTRQLVIWT